MEERPKSGTSTNNQRPSELDTITNHGTSRVLERLMICKSGVLTLDGSRSSNSEVRSLLIQLTTRSLKLETKRMKKDKLSLSTRDLEKVLMKRVFQRMSLQEDRLNQLIRDGASYI
jgi:hypothetical protein